MDLRSGGAFSPVARGRRITESGRLRRRETRGGITEPGLTRVITPRQHKARTHVSGPIATQPKSRSRTQDPVSVSGYSRTRVSQAARGRRRPTSSVPAAGAHRQPASRPANAGRVASRRRPDRSSSVNQAWWSVRRVRGDPGRWLHRGAVHAGVAAPRPARGRRRPATSGAPRHGAPRRASAAVRESRCADDRRSIAADHAGTAACPEGCSENSPRDEATPIGTAGEGARTSLPGRRERSGGDGPVWIRRPRSASDRRRVPRRVAGHP